MQTTEDHISLMCEMLKSGPQRYADLMLMTGLSKQTVFQFVKQLREARFVHVSGFTHDTRGRLFVPLFQWGGEADTPRPGPQRTAADRMRDMRARNAAKRISDV